MREEEIREKEGILEMWTDVGRAEEEKYDVIMVDKYKWYVSDCAMDDFKEVSQKYAVAVLLTGGEEDEYEVLIDDKNCKHSGEIIMWGGGDYDLVAGWGYVEQEYSIYDDDKIICRYILTTGGTIVKDMCKDDPRENVKIDRNTMCELLSGYVSEEEVKKKWKEMVYLDDIYEWFISVIDKLVKEKGYQTDVTEYST